MKLETSIAILAVSIFCLGFVMCAYEDARDSRFETIALQAAKAECMPEVTKDNPCFNIRSDGQVVRLCTGQPQVKK